MKLRPFFLICVTVLILSVTAFAISTLNCETCHNNIYSNWLMSAHAHTQAVVAGELSEERIGQTPHDVIYGEDAEDCVACHAPTAILLKGGMSESQVLGYFFTTINGKFTKNTTVAHVAEWPNVSCITCHKVPNDHPIGKATLALFNSQTGKYKLMKNIDELCGQCHGNLHFPDTDHLTYNGWLLSKHAHTQAVVASELSEERVGQTPHDVIYGEDAEDCVACHAPTAILLKGGMSESQVLGYFFTTINGKFTKNTTVAHVAEWPNVSCIVCHDPHTVGKLSYFNSSTKKYESMKSAVELCGQCHGNLRFPDTDHLSYNIWRGTGGIGVPDQKTMPGVTCVDCHMFVSNVDGSNSAMFRGHSWHIFVKEADDRYTTSCMQCHASMNKIEAKTIIDKWRSSFLDLEAVAQRNVTTAMQAMKGVKNKTLRKALKEAQYNLQYAECDESGGFHNHKYLMALLNDANSKALMILSEVSHK